MARGLGDSSYRLARDGIVDAWPASWPGWSFVRLSRGNPALPLLVRMHDGRLRTAHRAPRRAGKQEQ